MATLTPADRSQLEEQAPDVLDDIEAEERRKAELKYPEPTLADVQNLVKDTDATWESFYAQVEVNRHFRYLRDVTPEKWKRFMEGDRRIHTRLSHNEVLRVVASQTRNPLRVTIEAAGIGQAAEKRKRKQERWSNGLMAAFERAAGKALRRPFVDAQNGDGLVAWEVYLTDAYDGLDFDDHEVEEVDEYGELRRRLETPNEKKRRLDDDMIRAGMPVGLRAVEALALRYEEDDEGVCRVVIKERKNYRTTFNKLVDRLSRDKFDELRMPKPGTKGWPAFGGTTYSVSTLTQALAHDSSADGEVECLRYYDRRWYMEVVGDRVVELREHGLPGCPVFPCPGIVTSSANLGERYQGLTWGMVGLEASLNDMLTLAADVAVTYSRPRPAIETAVGGRLMLGSDKQPKTFDFSDPRRAPQLGEGQRVVDAFQGFQPKLPETVTGMLLNLWQRSGQNPIAQGQSPGSDPAGYTVNTLQGAALSLYEIFLDNEARTWGLVVDFCRRIVRDTLRDRWFLSVPMEDKRKGGTEWLGLAPEDIDETNCEVVIDPLSDAQRLAIRQSLTNGWKDRVITRRRLQMEGYGVQDPEVEDFGILEEVGMERLASMALDVTMQEIMAEVMPQMGMGGPGGPGGPGGSGLVDQNGNPIQSGGMGPGAMPAPPQPPTVGAQGAAASQGSGNGGRMPASRAMAGQDGGYRAPGGAIAQTAGA